MYLAQGLYMSLVNSWMVQTQDIPLYGNIIKVEEDSLERTSMSIDSILDRRWLAGCSWYHGVSFLQPFPVYSCRVVSSFTSRSVRAISARLCNVILTPLDTRQRLALHCPSKEAENKSEGREASK